MTRLLLSLLALCSIARADFDPARWQSRRSMAIRNVAPVASFTIDSSLYQNSLARLSDVRILRDSSEIPYIVSTLSGSREARQWQPLMRNKGAIPGTGVQATLDLASHPMHNQLRIVTSQHNFKQRVRVEISDDERSWAIARDDGYIFDFSQSDRKVAVLTVDYPVSTRRFVRLTIFGWTDPEFLESAWLTYYSASSATFDTVATITPLATEDAKTQSTVLLADIGNAGLPHDRVQLEITAGPFFRTVEVETSSDSKDWAFAGQGAISRTPDRENLTISFPEQWDRYLRLRILNHDNPPLGVPRLWLSTYRRVVEFPAERAGQYWVYVGNPDAKQPAYDFAQTMPRQAKAAEVTLGAAEANPAYQKPKPAEKPWSDRHPEVLYSVLVAAIVVMGLVAVKFLLKVSPR